MNLNLLIHLVYVVSYLKLIETHFPNREIEFSITISKNKSGHWSNELSLDKVTPNLPNNWKVDIKHTITENAEIQSYHLLGKLRVLPPQPLDYELFPGIGYYKFHYERKAHTFEEAVDICAQEGGHLAIINSEDEANVIRTLYSNTNQVQEFAYVGFKGPTKDGQWFTIFGDPLATTGYTKWLPNQPDIEEVEAKWCGSVDRNGLIKNSECQGDWPFICEYDLSWLASWEGSK